jgi:hypothetical protein
VSRRYLPHRLAASLIAFALTGGAGTHSRFAEAAPPEPVSTGPLRVHPENRRYFTDGTGKAIYLAGSHTWFSIQGPDAAPERSAAFVDFIKSRGHNFTRVWSFYSYLIATRDSPVNTPMAPWPYLRTGPGTAADGGPKFDLTKPDPTYVEHLRTFVRQARDRGIFCSIMLFGSYNQIRDKKFTNSSWHRGNNINPETSLLSTGSDFFEMYPDVLALQEAHVRHVIDALNEFDNIMWEVMNEAMDAPNASAWHHHILKVIRTYEATKPKQHLTGMTGGPDQSGAGQMSLSGADFVSPDNGTPGDYKNGGPAAYTGKVVLNDVDHLWGVSYDEALIRAWVWKTFTRGHHALFMEDRRVMNAAPLQSDDRIRYALGHTVNYSRRLDLARTTPRSDLSSTGYALADPGAEYLVYQPGSGAFTVNLAAGRYDFEWFDPVDGVVSATGTLRAATGDYTFVPPLAGEAVLYLKSAPPAFGIGSSK